MGELYNPYPKLPKNIRQIGERDQSVKLYLEDYVNTYLKRLYPKGGQDLRVGILLGTSEEHDGLPYLFVDGAMEMEDVAENGEKVTFTDAAWKKAYQNMEEMFPKRIILGWFLCGAPGAALSPLNYWKQHGQYFAGKNQLMYLNSGLEGEEAVYVTSEDGFYKLRGYSIYYERNQMMQDYMILRKDARRVESGTGDPVIRDFRQRMEDNRNQVKTQRGRLRVLGTLCSALAVIVLAGGVAMVNNYEKMKDMEAALTSALPAGIVLEDEEPSGELWVEEAPGEVYPTLASESMSGTYPGQGEPVQATEGQSNPEVRGKGQAQGNGQTTEVFPEGSSVGREEIPDSQLQQETVSESEGDDGQADSADHAVQMIDGQTYYKVQDGETLYGICLKIYGSGSKLNEICELNGLEDENKIISGQNLLLP